MSKAYDKYYKTENLFGQPYPELIDFFSNQPKGLKILDLGCGQGRDAIPLARMGFSVTGMDTSKVGITQMNLIAKKENLNLNGQIIDVFEFDCYDEFDCILLDSMFHFTKKDKKKETDFIKKILVRIKKGCIVVFCIQDTGKKVDVLNETIALEKQFERQLNNKFMYTFVDQASGHTSVSNYRMIVVKK